MWLFNTKQPRLIVYYHDIKLHIQHNIMHALIYILFFSSLTWIRIDVIIHDIAFRKQFAMEKHCILTLNTPCERFLRNVALGAHFYWSLFLACKFRVSAHVQYFLITHVFANVNHIKHHFWIILNWCSNHCCYLMLQLQEWLYKQTNKLDTHCKIQIILRGWSSLVWSADFKSVGDEICSVVRFHLLRDIFTL